MQYDSITALDALERPRGSTGPKPRPIAERFWSKVDKSNSPHGCWLWGAATYKNGYGQFGISRPGWRKSLYAHRVAWELVNGPIPEGMEVCHNCPGGDNPRCVNPSHLWLGTHEQNVADAAAKGTLTQGQLRGIAAHPERRAAFATRMKAYLAAHPERIRRGEQLHHAKLTADMVRAIRAKWDAQPERQRRRSGLASELAQEFGLSMAQLSVIVHRKTWKHV